MIPFSFSENASESEAERQNTDQYNAEQKACNKSCKAPAFALSLTGFFLCSYLFDTIFFVHFNVPAGSTCLAMICTRLSSLQVLISTVPRISALPLPLISS